MSTRGSIGRLLALVVAAITLLGCGGGGGQQQQTDGTGSTDTSTAAPQPPEDTPALTATPVNIDPDTVATLKGKVSFVGPNKPKPRPIRMAGDPFCNSAHPKPPMSETIVINKNGTIKNVFVYIKKGAPDFDYPLPDEAVVLDQVGCLYVPHVWGVRAGQKITIINSDTTAHNVHALPKKNAEFNKPQSRKGLKMTQVFKKPEHAVTIKCDVHPWMGTYCFVMEHPFFAVTDKNGEFEITGLPPGDYTVEAWHEKYETFTQQVTLSEKETKSIEFKIK